MMPRGDSPEQRLPGSPWPVVPIWLGLLVPPFAALTHVALGYPVEHTACALQSLLPFHLLTAILLGLVIICGIVSLREWRRNGATVPGEGPPPHGTRRLMALMGLLGAALFAFIIVVQWLPVTMLPPCVRT
jgi:hypothetical protein